MYYCYTEYGLVLLSFWIIVFLPFCLTVLLSWDEFLKMTETKREEQYRTSLTVEEPVELAEQIEDLFYHVRTDNIEEVKRLIEYEPIINDINVKDENKNSLLHFACANNHVDMILFLLFECSINYNETNCNGNTPLLWAIQNKNYEAVEALLSFDYYLNKCEYAQIEKKNQVFNSMKEPDRDMLKENYKLSDKGKLKIGTINMYNIYKRALESEEVDKLRKYKEHNRMELFKKNAYNKDIFTETFNINKENILHLVLSHPICHVLDNYCATTSRNGDVKIRLSTEEERSTENAKMGKGKEKSSEKEEGEEKNEEEGNGRKQAEELREQKDVHIYEKDEEYDSADESLNGDMTTDLAKAKIIQEEVRELIINENVKYNGKNLIIKIREIGLNYYGDCLDDKENKNDLTGIIIWEGCLLASKWLSDLCVKNFFADKKTVLEIGSGTGLASISLFLYASYANKTGGLDELVVSDINSFTLDNIRYNINLNQDVLHTVDPNWKDKIKVASINWGDENTYIKNEKNVIKQYDCIIGSDLIYDVKIVDSLIHLITKLLKKDGVFLYACKKNRSGVDFFYEQLKSKNFHVQFEPLKEEYFESPFLNMDPDVFDLKFSDMSDREFAIAICRKL